ncbi:amino acid ABC transporter substrate-binding protein [Sulfitobacter sp. SK012]|uniref:amino acid ABC transporter substrate-binding protein n=1 Tax=Sulfitobacter sp. SK012 TaxID=1389005 RepID=UPI000E0A67CE|nr:amino acid ABC transporter substrate-binding protein [Sulfitobacter sp. SK012]AXI44935.1 amino acid ABC transporter substrate-binding protein [Sulfitobacter sp. SK012]
MRLLTSTFLAAMLILPAALHAQTLERIKETGEIRLGYRTDAAPLSYEMDGKPRGYSPVVCYALAPLIGEQLGMTDIEVVFTPVDTKNRFEKVANGEIDLLCGASTITLARREIVDFSNPTYVDGTAVAMLNDAPDDLADMSGQSVGVRSGTTTLEALTNTLESDNIDAKIVSFANHSDGMAALEKAEIQGYFADQSILMYMLQKSENQAKFKINEGILTIEKHGLALARGDADFRLAVDRGLSTLFANGSMAKVFKKELPGAEPGAALEAMYLISPTIP